MPKHTPLIKNTRSPIVVLFVLALLALAAVLWSDNADRRAAVTSTSELDAMSVTQVLQRVIDKGKSTKTSVNDILATLDFDRVLQSMTQDEFLDTLTRYGQTPGYATRSALKNALPGRKVDLTNLKPYGIFQALAYPPKAPSLLKYDDTNPWEIPQKRYGDLQAKFEANRADFMEVFTTERLLAILADAIAPANGASKPHLVFTSLRLPGTYPSLNYDEELEDISEVSDDVLAQRAQQLKAKMDARPFGRRSAKIQGVERIETSPSAYGNMFPVLRESNGNPVTDTTGCIKDNAGGYLYSLWLDDPSTGYDWIKTVSARFDRFFKKYKEIGGNIDMLASDLEEDWWWWDTARCIWVDGKQSAVLNDPRWPDLKQELLDAGLTQADLDGMPNWPTDMKRDDWRRAIWDAVMSRRQIAAFNAAMYAPIKKYYPNIRFVEYEYYRRSQLIPYGNYRKYPRPMSMQSDILGTHQSVNMYGLAQPVSSPVKPNSNAIDSPTDRKNPTLYEKLISDANYMRTMSMSATDPIIPWLQHPFWDTSNPAAFSDMEEWHYERMYHVALGNVDDFLFWIYSGLEYNLGKINQNSYYARGYDVVQQAVNDLDSRIGYSDRKALPAQFIDYQSPYLLTGMEVHGKRIYRLTPNPTVPTVVKTVGTTVELWSNGVLAKRFPFSTVTQSHKGYWITQTKTESAFNDTVPSIIAAINVSSNLHPSPFETLAPAQSENGCTTESVYTNLGYTAYFPGGYSMPSPATLDRAVEYDVPQEQYIKYIAYGGMFDHTLTMKLMDNAGQSLGWYTFSKDKFGEPYRYAVQLPDKRAASVYFKQGHLFQGANNLSVTRCPVTQ